MDSKRPTRQPVEFTGSINSLTGINLSTGLILDCKSLATSSVRRNTLNRFPPDTLPSSSSDHPLLANATKRSGNFDTSSRPGIIKKKEKNYHGNLLVLYSLLQCKPVQWNLWLRKCILVFLNIAFTLAKKPSWKTSKNLVSLI